MQAALQESARLKHSCEGLRTTLSEQQSQLQTAKKESTALQQSCDGLRTEVKKKESQLQAAKNESATLKQSCDRLDAVVKEKDSCLQTELQVSAAHQQTCNGLRGTMAAMQEAKDTAEKNASHYWAEYHTVFNEVIHTKKQLEDQCISIRIFPWILLHLPKLPASSIISSHAHFASRRRVFACSP